MSKGDSFVAAGFLQLLGTSHSPSNQPFLITRIVIPSPFLAIVQALNCSPAASPLASIWPLPAPFPQQPTEYPQSNSISSTPPSSSSREKASAEAASALIPHIHTQHKEYLESPCSQYPLAHSSPSQSPLLYSQPPLHRTHGFVQP